MRTPPKLVEAIKRAQQINTLLAAAEPGDNLDKLLAIAPATAALYENQQYADAAGLCRTPFEAALQAELAAVAAIDKARLST